MPNWCVNTVDVLCPPERLDDVRRSILRDDLTYVAVDFALVVPEPDDLPDDALYWWRVNNWGTKWNVVSDEVDPDVAVDDRRGFVALSLRFDTAWAPPTTWLAAVSERFPDATFAIAYDEPGIDFAGYVVYVAGDDVASEDGPSELATLYDDEDPEQYAPTWTDRSLTAAIETHDRRQQ